MKFGETMRGKIETLDEKGRGVFALALTHAPGEIRSVRVPFTAVGDDVEALFVKRERGAWVGRLGAIRAPSTDRVAASCPHASVCGGCLWQHLDYDAQRREKKTAINASLARAGHDERVDEVQPSIELFYYRNRMDYAVGWQGQIGLKEYGYWNRPLDLSTCHLLDRHTPKTLEIVRGLMRAHRLAPWDAKRHEGLMRYVVIRLGRHTAQRQIMLVVHDASALSSVTRADIVEQLAPMATSICVGENPDVTDLSSAKTIEVLHGDLHLQEEVNGITYAIHPNAFFQTNTAMAASLQRVVLGFLEPLSGRTVLDLYCGLGFFGIACARAGANVYGHEIDMAAIELAKMNAEKNGVAQRAIFGAGPVEAISSDLWDSYRPDAIIVDPPRSGLHPAALRMILAKKPETLVYVSCNHRRFAEELKELKKNFRVTDLVALDLFPHTPHVELVARLTRL